MNTEMWKTDDSVGVSFILFLVLIIFTVCWCNTNYATEKVVAKEEAIGLNIGDVMDNYNNHACHTDYCYSGGGSLRSDTLSAEAYSMDTRELEAGIDTEEQIQEEIEAGECEMLAQLLQAEAGNQDYKGMCLVADVVINRVKSSSFPDNVEDVIFQYLTDKYGEDHYQFSTVIDGSYDNAGWEISDNAFKAAYQEYYAERRVDDRLLYFTAGSYNPYCIPAYKYGDHYFGY